MIRGSSLMNESLIRIAARKEVLIAQAASQRRVLAQSFDAWRKPLALADRGLRAIHFVKSHPVLLAGSVLLPGAMQPGRVGKWLRRGFAAWQIVNKLRVRT